MTQAIAEGSPVYILYTDDVDHSERETLGWLAIEWGGWVYIHHDKPIEYPGSSNESGKGMLLRSESIIEKRIINKGELIEAGSSIKNCVP